MSYTPTVTSIASAITSVENTNPSLNNPGGIMDYSYFKQTGLFRLQQYPTPEAGQTALLDLTDKYVNQGNTLDSFFGNYAPYGHGSNDPAVYAQTVSKKTGIPVDTPLNSIGSGGSTPYVTSTITYPQGEGEGNITVDNGGESLFSGLDTTLADLSSGWDTTDSSVASGSSNWAWVGIFLVAGIIVYKMTE